MIVHCLIVGQGTSGKTILAQQLAASYKKRGLSVLVYDPINDPAWLCDYRTDDPQAFLWEAKRRRDCALFVDEAGTIYGLYEPRYLWLGTMSRHWGHIAHFIAQRTVQVEKTVRDQCDTAFLFKVGLTDAKTLADEFACAELEGAVVLPQFHAYRVGRFSPLEKIVVSPNGRH